MNQHGDDESKVTREGYTRFLVDTPLTPTTPTLSTAGITNANLSGRRPAAAGASQGAASKGQQQQELLQAVQVEVCVTAQSARQLASAASAGVGTSSAANGVANGDNGNARVPADADVGGGGDQAERVAGNVISMSAISGEGRATPLPPASRAAAAGVTRLVHPSCGYGSFHMQYRLDGECVAGSVVSGAGRGGVSLSTTLCLSLT
jgi:hypothetical protein